MKSRSKTTGSASSYETDELYFDSQFNAYGKRIHPGEYKIAQEPDHMLTTILGSCVAACIRDPLTGIGGMNHFLLPEGNAPEHNLIDDPTRYGNHAMEILINDLLKLGCRKDRFEVKVFGGANVGNMKVSIGQQNSDFVLKYIEQEGLNLISYDLGGEAARRIYYFPQTGKVSRFLFPVSEKVTQREMEHRNQLRQQKAKTDIELFV